MSSLTDFDLDAILEGTSKVESLAPKKPIKPLSPTTLPSTTLPSISKGVDGPMPASPSSDRYGPSSPARLFWESYIDRYPNSLGNVYETIIKPTGISKASFGERHYYEYGQYEGRVVNPMPGEEVIDYGFYVENYGNTLVEPFRRGSAGPIDQTLFGWGKWHYETYGKREGRSAGGGLDWGAIIRNNKLLMAQYTDSKKKDPNLTAFQFGFENQYTVLSSEGVKLGTNEADIITGRRVFALASNDIITGTNDNDIIYGGPGDDIIDGGKGTDLIYGGGGSDLFKIPTEGFSLVRDFRKGADAIQVQPTEIYNLKLGLAYPGTISTDFEDSAKVVRMNVMGIAPWDFTFASKSGKFENVYV